MAAEASITIDTKALEKALAQVPKKLHDELEGAFNRSLVEFTAAMDERFQGASGPPWWDNKGEDIVSRTGNLARSLGFQVDRGGNLSQLRGVSFVGDSRTPYAATQEYGATITGSPWLTIPMPDNYTASGVPRYQSAAALRDDPSVRTWVQRSASGALIIRAQFEGDEDIKNLWLLKRQVTIPPRLRFAKTFEGQRKRQIFNVNRAVDRALIAATRGAS